MTHNTTTNNRAFYMTFTRKLANKLNFFCS